MGNYSKLYHIGVDLLAMGSILVKIEYSGSGDSGGVDSISFINDLNQTISPIVNEQEIDALGESLTDLISGDWVNNDGGQGSIRWDLKTNKIVIKESYNESSTYDEPIRTIQVQP